MSKALKYGILALVVVLVGAAVTGIAFWSLSYDPDYRAPGLYIDGKLIDNPASPLTIGNTEISFADYRHYYQVTRSSIEMYYGGDIWADDPDGEKAIVLRDSVREELLTQCAWLKIAAEDNITLGEEDMEEINTTLASQKETYGDAFADRLGEMFFDSEEDYLRLTELQKLSTKTQTEYRSAVKAEIETSVAEQADADYDKNYITAKHILIAFDMAETDTAKADADALTEITGLLDEIRASDDPIAAFEDAMWANTDDMEGLEGSPNGYTFTEGDMVPEFFNTAMSTAEGEISEPVRTDYGYHIILRLPLAEDGKESKRITAVETAVSEKVNERLDAVKESLTMVFSDYYTDITPTGIV